MNGYGIRLKRISEEGRFIIVPMDHGTTLGPIGGLIDAGETIDKVNAGGATAIVVHKGVAKSGLRNSGGSIGFILHLSASTSVAPDPDSKALVSSVEEAIMLGADAVSVHVNMGADTESKMLRDLGTVSSSCRRWSVPLLAMMYARGRNIMDGSEVDRVKHVARLGAELGADIIKTNYTGSKETFREVTRGCPVPVVIAGGPKMESDRDVLNMIRDSIEAGGKGVSIGRNVFQHPDTEGVVRAIRKIVIGMSDVEDALEEIGK